MPSSRGAELGEQRSGKSEYTAGLGCVTNPSVRRMFYPSVEIGCRRRRSRRNAGLSVSLQNFQKFDSVR